MKNFGKKLALVTLSACMALFFAACSSDSDNSDPTQPAQSSEDGQNGEGQGGEGGDQPAAENTFTDPRDGKTYKFVTIGSQTWFAQNLNFDVTGSSCYDDNPANCDTYGRLYTHDAAANACPSGWHLPSFDEGSALLESASSNGKRNGEGDAGKFLKSASGWSDGGNGEDSYGFNLLPAGYFNTDMNNISQYKKMGSTAQLWTVSEATGGYWNCLFFNTASYVAQSKELANTKMSVRCVKD